MSTVPEPRVNQRQRQGSAGSKIASTSPTAPTGGQPSERQSEPGWAFLAYLSGAHFLTMYGFYVMLTWLPYYLETVRGLKGGLSAVIPVVMPLILAPSTILWGRAADRRKTRDFVLRICLPVSTVAVAAIPLTGGPIALAAALALYGATGKLVIDPILVSAVSENAPARTRSTTLAVFNSAASLAMVLAPSVTGLIAEWTGSFDVSFYAAGGFHLLALVSYLQGMRLLARWKAGAGQGAPSAGGRTVSMPR